MAHGRLQPEQRRGFWAAWSGWVLDGMDSFIYALALAPALTELLPASGYSGSPAQVAFAGSVLFALFLIGWGLSFLWGPVADRIGRIRTLSAAIACYAVFTAGAALAHDVWQFAICRLLAGIGIGGEWSLAGTYVAESWPEDRRVRGAGYLQTGYYVGFFLAAALNYTVGAIYGWRALFLCGGLPVLVAIYVARSVREPERWRAPAERASLRRILTGQLRRRTLINAGLATVSIVGLWAGTVYEPTAILQLAKQAGYSAAAATRWASFGTGLLSICTILGCLAVPPLAQMLGRRQAHALLFLGMAVSIYLSFGWAFYSHQPLLLFIATLVPLGFFGGNFAMYSLWLPEQYPTAIRATAFAFVTSFGRFIGAGINFAIGAGVAAYGSIGMPVASTALAFLLGLLLLPAALETRGAPLPD
jgi:MFS family permease